MVWFLELDMAEVAGQWPSGLQMLADEAWLRGGAIEAVLHEVTLPREVVYRFASRCIAVGLQEAERQQLALPAASYAGALALHDWLHDACSTEEWHRAARQAWEAMVAIEETLELTDELCATDEYRPHCAAYQLARAIAWSGVKQSKEAADMTAWCVAEGLAYLVPPHRRTERWIELRRDQRHLLVQEVAACLREHRSQILELLQLRASRANDTVTQLQDALQDALFGR